MSSSIQNSPQSHWPSLNRFGVQFIAGACAMVPTYYGYALKSARQLGKAAPPITFETTIKGGFRTAPNVGFTVATQMAVQNFFQHLFSQKTAEPSLSGILASSTLAGIVCSPLLAGFNGQTMNRSFLQSLKTTTPKQTMAIASRETSFIASVQMNDPLLAIGRRIFGNEKWVDYGTAFLSGSLGSIVGHPADTLLSLLQTEERIQIAHLMKGLCSRTVATGLYVILYKQVEERLIGIQA